MPEPEVPYEQLDFIYAPTRDAAEDLAYFRTVLGARVAFAVDEMGTRVAGIELAPMGPMILLAEHLEGERPILVFRVGSLHDELAAAEARGWTPERTFEIPHGPCCSFRTPGGQRIALYQLDRPEATRHLQGRSDF
jgi:catechol 2,3-dioxygenase-like lactoylglutathione lyase family enzyme